MQENKVKPWWEPGVEIFSKVSGWIAAPIILSLILGKYLDGKFDTNPWIFISLTSFAFIISCYGIVKVVKEYMKKIEGQDKMQNKDKNSNGGTNS